MRAIDVRSVLIGVLATLVVIVSLGAYKAKDIEADRIKARTFQIVDPNGKVRGAFAASEGGDAILSLGAPGEENQYTVWVTQAEEPQGGNVVVTIKGPRGEMRITSGPHGDAGPLIYMGNGKECVLKLGAMGNPGSGVVWTKICDANAPRDRSWDFDERTSIQVYDKDGLAGSIPEISETATQWGTSFDPQQMASNQRIPCSFLAKVITITPSRGTPRGYGIDSDPQWVVELDVFPYNEKMPFNPGKRYCSIADVEAVFGVPAQSVSGVYRFTYTWNVGVPGKSEFEDFRAVRIADETYDPRKGPQYIAPRP